MMSQCNKLLTCAFKFVLRILVQYFCSLTTQTVALFCSKYSYNEMLTLLEKLYSVKGKNSLAYSVKTIETNKGKTVWRTLYKTIETNKVNEKAINGVYDHT